MNTSAKIAHPNRLVLKHEQFLINKSLSNKIKNVKSTLNFDNRNFERIIVTRQKKDPYYSLLLKTKSTEDALDSEATQSDYNQQISYPHSRELPYKRAEIQPLRIITPSARENFENKDNLSFSNKTGVPSIMASPRLITDWTAGLKTPGCSLGHISATKRMDKGSLSPVRAQLTGDKRVKENQVDLLKSRLIEKSLEAEYIKKELKGWWHEDVKGVKDSQSKENIREDRYNSSIIGKGSGVKTTKGVVSIGKIGSSREQQSDKKLKSLMPLEAVDRKQLIGSVTKLATYEESLRILEKFEEMEKNKKTQKERSSERYQFPESPLTPKQTLVSNNLKLNVRFSSNLESRTSKASIRYKTEEDLIEEENTGYEVVRVNTQESLGTRNENASAVKEKYTNVKQRTLELEGEDCSDEEEGSRKPTKAKTMILQSKTQNQKISNSSSFRLPKVTTRGSDVSVVE